METVDRIFDLASKKFKDQKDFAAALNVSTTMISAWRTGVSQSYKRRLPQIAKILDTTASYLLGEEEKPAIVADELTSEEQTLLLAYRAADNRTRQMVELALEPWKKSSAPDVVM